jgi:hypothetical protein
MAVIVKGKFEEGNEVVSGTQKQSKIVTTSVAAVNNLLPGRR